VHKGKLKFSLANANQVKKMIIFGKKFVLLFLRENHLVEELTSAKASLEGCTKKHKKQLAEFL